MQGRLVEYYDIIGPSDVTFKARQAVLEQLAPPIQTFPRHGIRDSLGGSTTKGWYTTLSDIDVESDYPSNHPSKHTPYTIEMELFAN